MISLSDIGFLGFLVSSITFILFCVIAYRLKIIMINTFKSSKSPGVNHYAEAMANEKIGDTTQARKHYYLAYWSLNELSIKRFKWNGDWIKVKDIETKLGFPENDK